MNDELLFERLASRDGPAPMDTAFEDRLYLVLQREMRGRHALRPALLLAATLVVALTLTAAIAVGSGLINAPWVNPHLIPEPSQPASEAPIEVFRGSDKTPGRVYLFGGGLAYDWFGLDIVATLPAGWDRGMPTWGQFGIVRVDSRAKLLFWNVDTLVADPCSPTVDAAEVAVGPTVDELAAALEAIPELEATTSANITLDQWIGKRMTLSIRDTCEEVELWRWHNSPSNGEMFEQYIRGDEIHELWLLDIDGQRLVIDAQYAGGTSVELESELRQIVASIDIEPQR